MSSLPPGLLRRCTTRCLSGAFCDLGQAARVATNGTLRSGSWARIRANQSNKNKYPVYVPGCCSNTPALTQKTLAIAGGSIYVRVGSRVGSRVGFSTSRAMKNGTQRFRSWVEIQASRSKENHWAISISGSCSPTLIGFRSAK
jgi:hypothetical protein